VEIRDNRDLFKSRQQPAPDTNEYEKYFGDSDKELSVRETDTGFGTMAEFLQFAMRELIVNTVNDVKAQKFKKKKRNLRGLNKAKNDVVPVQIAAEVLGLHGEARTTWEWFTAWGTTHPRVKLADMHDAMAARVGPMIQELQELLHSYVDKLRVGIEPRHYVLVREAFLNHQTDHLMLMSVAIVDLTRGYAIEETVQELCVAEDKERHEMYVKHIANRN
jgi:hypothetical protein